MSSICFQLLLCLSRLSSLKNVQKLLSASVSCTLGALITPFTAWAEVTSDPLMPSAKDSGLCSLGGEHLLGAMALLAPLSWIPLKYQDTQVQSWTLFPICLLSLGRLLAQDLLVYLQTIPLSWASNWNLELSSKTISKDVKKKKKLYLNSEVIANSAHPPACLFLCSP